MAAGTKTATAGIDHAAIAARLREAYAGRPLAPIRDALAGATADDAYAIQSENTRFWLREGRKRVGAKIGLTAKSVQAQLGVDQPDFGALFADMQVEDGGTVAAGRLIQPKVEAEIAFVLGHTPDPAADDLSALADAVAHALPAIEIVDSRIENWNIGLIDTIADNASSGLFVLGTTPAALRNIDLQLCGMVLEKNGEPTSFGAGAACLGNPLIALRWLARRMASLGSPLAKGDIVLAGALGPMIAAAPGDTFTASIAGLGSVHVQFGR
ncbi:MAG: fumarylacetoacetate hydrolase family protein [Rhizomicrobium sp.]